METNTVKDEEETKEQIHHCPACKTKCVRGKYYNKSLRIEQEVWVCPEQKYKSCI
jgi:ribosomal protein L37AE/L43A